MSGTHSRRFVSALLRGVARGIFSAAIGGTFMACAGDPSAETSVSAPSDQVSDDSMEASLAGGGGFERQSCPCGQLNNPLRATIMEVRPGSGERPGSVRLRVEEILGNTADVKVGSEIDAGWSGRLPCMNAFPTAAPLTIAAGDAVLAFYSPATPCPLPGVCADGDTISAGVALTPWGDTWVLADTSRDADFTISVDELSLLDAPFEECLSGVGDIFDFLGPGDDFP